MKNLSIAFWSMLIIAAVVLVAGIAFADTARADVISRFHHHHRHHHHGNNPPPIQNPPSPPSKPPASPPTNPPAPPSNQPTSGGTVCTKGINYGYQQLANGHYDMNQVA